MKKYLILLSVLTFWLYSEASANVTILWQTLWSNQWISFVNDSWFNPTYINDDNISTEYIGNGDYPFPNLIVWVIMTTPQVVNVVRSAWFDSVDTIPTDYTIQWSNNTTNWDDGTWTTIKTVTGNTSNDKTDTISTNCTAYKAYRMNISSYGIMSWVPIDLYNFWPKYDSDLYDANCSSPTPSSSQAQALLNNVWSWSIISTQATWSWPVGRITYVFLWLIIFVIIGSIVWMIITYPNKHV